MSVNGCLVCVFMNHMDGGEAERLGLGGEILASYIPTFLHLQREVDGGVLGSYIPTFLQYL